MLPSAFSTASAPTKTIISLTEGCSIRSTERMTGTHRDSVMRLGVRVGQGCENVHNRYMRDLQVNLIELDEQWDFIQKKQKRVLTDRVDHTILLLERARS
jgi:hypothetical protein